jgi:hypothetical protein
MRSPFDVDEGGTYVSSGRERRRREINEVHGVCVMSDNDSDESGEGTDDDDDARAVRAVVKRRLHDAAPSSKERASRKKSTSSESDGFVMMNSASLKTRMESWRAAKAACGVPRRIKFGTCVNAYSRTASAVCERWGVLKSHPVICMVSDGGNDDVIDDDVGTCPRCYHFLSNGEWARDVDGTQFQCTLCGHGDEHTMAFLCETKGCDKIVCEPCVEAIEGQSQSYFYKKNADAAFVCYACDVARLLAQLKQRKEQPIISALACIGQRRNKNTNMNQYLIQKSECGESGVAKISQLWVDDDANYLTEEQSAAIYDWVLQKNKWTERGGPVKTQVVVSTHAAMNAVSVTEFMHCFPTYTGEMCSFGLTIYENVFTYNELAEFEREIYELAMEARSGKYGGEPFIANAGATTGRVKIFFGYAYEKAKPGQVMKQRLIRTVPGLDDPRATILCRMADLLSCRGVLPDDFTVDQIVVNVYMNASSFLLAHKDACHLFDDGIYSVRLFNPRILAFAPDKHMRMNTDRGVVRALQSRGSVTAMTEFAKEDIQHCVPPVPSVSREYFSASVMFRMANKNAIKRAVKE